MMSTQTNERFIQSEQEVPLKKKPGYQWNGFQRFCFQFLRWITGLLAVVLTVLVAANIAGRYGNPVSFNPLIYIPMAAAMLIVLMIFFERGSEPDGLQFARKRPLICITLAVIAIWALHLLIASVTWHSWSGDAGMLLNPVTGTADAQAYQTFIAAHPNQIFLSSILSGFAGFMKTFTGMNPWMSAAFLSVTAGDLGILLAAYSAYKLKGTRFMILSTVMLIMVTFLQPLHQVPYVDVFAFLAVSGFLFGMVLMIRADLAWTKCCGAILAAVFLTAGCFIKISVLIAAIAALLCLLILLPGQIARRWAVSTLCLVLFGASCYGTMVAEKFAENSLPDAEQLLQDEEVSEMPVSYYLMSGLNDNADLHRYGAYSAEDFERIFSIEGKDEKNSEALRVIRERLSALGFVGLINHLADKFVWISTDGTFGYDGTSTAKSAEKAEGLSYLGFLNDSSDDFYQLITANFLQAGWLLVLLGMCFILLPEKRRNRPSSAVLFMMELSVIGLFLYVLIFQADSQYLYLYLPYFVLIGAYGYSLLFNRLFPKPVSAETGTEETGSEEADPAAENLITADSEVQEPENASEKNSEPDENPKAAEDVDAVSEEDPAGKTASAFTPQENGADEDYRVESNPDAVITSENPEQSGSLPEASENEAVASVTDPAGQETSASDYSRFEQTEASNPVSEDSLPVPEDEPVLERLEINEEELVFRPLKRRD